MTSSPQVDAAPYQQSVSQAEAELVAASAAAAPTYRTVTVPDSGSSDNGGRRAELKAWYNMGALSKVEYNQMMADSGGGTQTVQVPEAAPVNQERISQLQQAIQTARDMLGNATIYSPIEGRVTAVSDNPSIAVAGNVLATIQQMSPLVATFAVPEMYVKALSDAKSTGSLQISIIAPSGETETGELTYLATEKDPSTGSIWQSQPLIMPRISLFPVNFTMSALPRHRKFHRLRFRRRLSVPRTAVISFTSLTAAV